MNVLSKLDSLARPLSGKLAKPGFLQFRVDEICFSTSGLRNVWQQQPAFCLEVDRLVGILENPLFSEIKIVEICGTEPVLDPNLAEVISLLFEKLPKLTCLDLVTSVSNPDDAINCIRQIGNVTKSHARQFNIRLSLPTWNNTLNGSNNPASDLQTLTEVICFLRNFQPISNYKLECTITKENIYQLQDILEFAIAQGVEIAYKLGVPYQQSLPTHIADPREFDFSEKYHLAIFLENLIRFYEKSETQIWSYLSLVGQLIYGKPRQVGCKWQSGGITLTATGDLLYCAVESKALGSTIERNPETLYEENQLYLAHIFQTKCHSCLQDCIIPAAPEGLSKAVGINFLGRIGLSMQSVKSLKVLKPLKTLKAQLDFQQQMKNLGVSQEALASAKPTLRFSRPADGKRKVLICGWYGTETLGDKAILGGVIHALREGLGEFELHLAAIETYISQMTVLQMPELEGCVLHSISESLDLTGSMDLVVFGGGPLMAIGPMAEMLAIFQRAVQSNVPTLLAGCGVGPLGATFLNDAVKQTLLHSSYRIYRDQKSLEIARSLDVDVSRDVVAEDPAFTWLASRTDCFHINPDERNITTPRLLLGLRDWPYHEFAAEMGNFEAEQLKLRFEAELLTGLEQLVEQHPMLKVVPFPMCTNHLGFDDRWFYRRLFRNRPKLQPALDSSYLGAELSPDQAIAVYQSASAALTMRFHSLIFALSNGVPAVAVDYTLGRGKVKSLAEKYQVPYMGLDSINAEFLVSSLSPLLAGQPSTSFSAFQERTLTFKDSVKSLVTVLNQYQ
jgi:polysaccharide pyruvyl transferase WcaK-like protein